MQTTRMWKHVKLWSCPTRLPEFPRQNPGEKTAPFGLTAAHFCGQLLLLWPGDRQSWHLCARRTLPRHSPPTGTSAHVPLACAHEKHISAPVLSFDFPLPWFCPLPWPLSESDLWLFNLRSSSRSSHCLFLRADRLSLFAWRLLSSLSSLGACNTSEPPTTWVAAMASAGATGTPWLPAAVHAAAGCRTCSDQYCSSLASILKQADHGFCSSQSNGNTLPACWSIMTLRLIFSKRSARPLSSASTIKPHANGHCNVSFSMAFSYCCNAARLTMPSASAATLKTLQHAIHWVKFCGPGSSLMM